MIDLILPQVLEYGAFGVLLGAAYFSALGWNVRLYAGHGAGWSAVLLHLVRLLLTGAAFTLCARQGAAQLLSSVAGFQLMRTSAIYQQRLELERKL